MNTGSQQLLDKDGDIRSTESLHRLESRWAA